MKGTINKQSICQPDINHCVFPMSTQTPGAHQGGTCRSWGGWPTHLPHRHSQCEFRVAGSEGDGGGADGWGTGIGWNSSTSSFNKKKKRKTKTGSDLLPAHPPQHYSWSCLGRAEWPSHGASSSLPTDTWRLQPQLWSPTDNGAMEHKPICWV